MTFLIAIGIALLAVFLLVAILKLAFNLVVLAVVIGLGVGAYFLAEKLVGQGH